MAHWYHKKVEMLAGIKETSSTRVFLGRDAGKGKAMTSFPCFEDMEKYVNNAGRQPTHPPCLYELIFDKTTSKVYMYFDLDRDMDPVRDTLILADLDSYRDRFVHAFLSAFEAFLLIECDTKVSLVPGVNCQIASSSHPARLSVHMKIDIPCGCPLVVKDVSTCFKRFVFTLSQEEQDMFVFHHFDANKQKTVMRSVVDDSVYSHFRHFRLLYSAKRKGEHPVPKLPWEGSSTQLRDHVVQQHETVVAPASFKMMQQPKMSMQRGFGEQQRVGPRQAVVTDVTAHLTPSASVALNAFTDPHRTTIRSIIPSVRLAAVRASLLGMQGISDRLSLDGPLAFRHEYDVSPTDHSFGVDPACLPMCPYAGRRHRHNRLTLLYCHTVDKVVLHCFNEECRKRMGKIVYHVGCDPAINTAMRVELDAMHSLHCRQDVIEWAHVYDHYTMHDYPLAPIVCVRSNMGTGKTLKLIDFIQAQCLPPVPRPSAISSCGTCDDDDGHVPVKCLMITYQVLLSRKYQEQLQRFGFVNYLDKTGPSPEIRDNKVIVCLDSLWRVKTMDFDFVFIDEALSVLLHFNSSLMKRVSDISIMFELLLRQARHIYLLDAAVDNAVVHEFVLYLERIKDVKAVWIRNTYRKETNRSATLLVNGSTKPGNRQALMAASVKHVIDALAADRRIVISSTTKRFTDVMAREVARQAPGKRVVVYNSSTDRTLLHAHAMDPHAAWVGYDVLIYSPTIGAGISFEIPHFDELVAWVENGLDSASVDLCIQQLYRVRQLASGRMTLFVQNTAAKPAASCCAADGSESFPTTADEIETWLDASINTSTSYLSKDLAGQSKTVSSTGRRIIYDQCRLSYHVLKGIVYAKHKSLIHFEAILEHTLRADYGIACDVQRFCPQQVDMEAADVLTGLIRAYDRSTVIPFDADLIVTSSEYDDLVERQMAESKPPPIKTQCTRQKGHHGEEEDDNAMAPLGPRQHLQIWVHMMCTNVYGIDPLRCDQAFFDGHIGQATRACMAEAYETFYRILRFSELIGCTAAQSAKRYEAKMAAIVDLDDRNMELYRTRLRVFNETIIAGSRLLECMYVGTDIDVHTVLAKREALVLSPKQMLAGFRRWAAGTTPNQYAGMLKRLRTSAVRKYSIASLVDPAPARRALFFKAVMEASFGIQVACCEEGTNNASHPMYGYKKLSAIATFELVDEYVPTAFSMTSLRSTTPPVTAFMFADD